MGQSHGERALDAAFAKDGCRLLKTYSYGSTGVGALAQTKSLQADDAGSILQRSGPYKTAVYVRGTGYEMGFLIGRMLPDEVEAVCTTYIEHIAPQFVSEAFDLAMRRAPLLFKVAYDTLLGIVTEILIRQSVNVFKEAVKNGDIPSRIIQEMRGMLAGCASVKTVSLVTLERIIAANYGLDYMIVEIFSGRLLEQVKQAIKLLPREVSEMLPKMRAEFFSVPDMCNGAMVSGPATESKRDVYLLRDFQFQNSYVFHKTCTLIIRQPVDPDLQLSCVVTIPGLVGCVTALNISGLACGLTMVRSGAVDMNRLGMGALILMREIVDRCSTVDQMEQLTRQIYMGCPWILYGIDEGGCQVVLETIGRSHDTVENLVPAKWVDKKQILSLMPQDMDAWRQKDALGVWKRTGQHPTETDETLRIWSEPLVKAGKHPELVDPERWSPGGLLYMSWQDEHDGVRDLGNFYFPPWRPIGPGVCVINNSFLNPVLRLTQMNNLITMLERTSVGNQYRYDTLILNLKNEYGHLDFEKCRDIITFLSPWKRPDYPQNLNAFAKFQAMLGTIMEPEVPIERGDTVISGALTVVDVLARRIENKNGYWGTEWYGLSLRNYVFSHFEKHSP